MLLSGGVFGNCTVKLNQSSGLSATKNGPAKKPGAVPVIEPAIRYVAARAERARVHRERVDPARREADVVGVPVRDGSTVMVTGALQTP